MSKDTQTVQIVGGTKKHLRTSAVIDERAKADIHKA